MYIHCTTKKCTVNTGNMQKKRDWTILIEFLLEINENL